MRLRESSPARLSPKIGSLPQQRYNARDVPQTQTVLARAQKKSGGARAPPLPLTNERLLAEVVRNVVEGRVQLVADALHRSNRGNGNQRGDQAVLDRGRTLAIFDQLQKLAHGLRSSVRGDEAPCHAGSASPLPPEV